MTGAVFLHPFYAQSCFFTEGYFQYNPDLAEQPEEVQWIIRGSFSIVPGLAGLLGTVVLFWFTLRTNESWTFMDGT
jgi:Na+/melibiose symporter-like transporter